MNNRQKFLFTSLLGFVALAASAFPAAAAISLGTASSFAVLGGPAVTCTDSSIKGDVGTGFLGGPVVQTRCPVAGNIHAGDAAAQQAYNDFRLAYLATAQVACPTDPAHNLTGTLAGVTLAPGVYCFAAAATLTGTLTLDGQGNPNATWLFKVAGNPLVPAALTATNFSVVMVNGAMPCNVTWWVNAAATITSSSMVGTIMAGADITFTGAGSFIGRALATQAVTVTTESSFGSCGGAAGGGGGDEACDQDDDRDDGHHVGRRGDKHHEHDSHHGKHCGKAKESCNQGVGNGPEGCDPGKSDHGYPFRSNDEINGVPGNPGRKGGNK